jgi:hypothetical protein
MRCPFCNNLVPDDSVYCTFCGKNVRQTVNQNPIPNSYQNPYSQRPPMPQTDDAGCLAIFVSFFSPFVGLALYLIWKDYRPSSAKTCLITALISLAISILGGIIAVITSILAAMSAADGFYYLIKLVVSCIRL